MTDMEPVIQLSTPPFSSPDPETEGLRMLPIDDNPEYGEHEESDIDDDATENPEPRVGEVNQETAVQDNVPRTGDKKAGDWVAEIEAAQDQDALDSILSDYAETGKDFKSVAEAAEKRQDEIDEEDAS